MTANPFILDTERLHKTFGGLMAISDLSIRNACIKPSAV